MSAQFDCSSVLCIHTKRSYITVNTNPSIQRCTRFFTHSITRRINKFLFPRVTFKICTHLLKVIVAEWGGAACLHVPLILMSIFIIILPALLNHTCHVRGMLHAAS